MYGEDVLTKRKHQNLFAEFRSGHFEYLELVRSGRPVEADETK